MSTESMSEQTFSDHFHNILNEFSWLRRTHGDLERENEDLRTENAELRAVNDALREALLSTTVTSEQMGMPSLKYQEIKNDDFTEELKEDLRHAIADAFSGPVRPATPRVITADELREGQTVAAFIEDEDQDRPAMVAGRVTDVQSFELRSLNSSGPDDEYTQFTVSRAGYQDDTWSASTFPSIVLLEDAPEPERDAPPRLTVHKLNVAPEGSRVDRSGFTSRVKGRDGLWRKYSLGMLSKHSGGTSEELVADGWGDATLIYPGQAA